MNHSGHDEILPKADKRIRNAHAGIYHIAAAFSPYFSKRSSHHYYRRVDTLYLNNYKNARGESGDLDDKKRR